MKGHTLAQIKRIASMWIHTVSKFFHRSRFLRNLRLPWNFSLYWIYFLHSGFLTTCASPENSFPWNFSLYWIYFYHSRFLSNFALALNNRVAQKFFTLLNTLFYIQDFWATCACPEEQSAPWNFSPYGIYFLPFRILEQLGLALKKQSCPEIFHCIEIYFIIQDFWATRDCPEKQLPWNFPLYWMCTLFIIQEFWETCAYPQQQSMPWIDCTEYVFLFIQDFSATCACPEKHSCPENFHCIEYVFFIIQEFWATCAWPQKQSCPGIFHLYWNNFYNSGFLSNLRLPWNFSLYWIYFLHLGVLSNLRLPWNFSLYWIRIFYHSGFLSNFPWKTELPWHFSPVLKYFSSFRILAISACPENFQAQRGGRPPDPYAHVHQYFGDTS